MPYHKSERRLFSLLQCNRDHPKGTIKYLFNFEWNYFLEYHRLLFWYVNERSKGTESYLRPCATKVQSHYTQIIFTKKKTCVYNLFAVSSTAPFFCLYIYYLLTQHWHKIYSIEHSQNKWYYQRSFHAEKRTNKLPGQQKEQTHTHTHRACPRW